MVFFNIEYCEKKCSSECLAFCIYEFHPVTIGKHKGVMMKNLTKIFSLVLYITIFSVFVQGAAVDDNFTTPYNTQLSENVLTNDSGKDMYVSNYDTPSCGSIFSSDPDGSFTYEPGTCTGTVTFVYTMRYKDRGWQEDQATVTITVEEVNQPPVANAGPDQSVLQDQNVTLDGSGSTDDVGITSYSWDVNGHTYTGVNPVVDSNDLNVGDNNITLTVTDGAGETDTDTVKITVTITVPLSCANPKSFDIVFQSNDHSKMIMAGNTNLCKRLGSSGHTCDPNGASRSESNNDIYMINNDYDNIENETDSSKTTLNSSAAYVDIPTDKEVLWAGLFWQGYFAGTYTENDKSEGESVKFKQEGNNYDSITGDMRWVYFSSTRMYYQGFADVTDYVKTHGGGYYWVGDIATSEGQPIGGSYGGWSLAVVYRDNSEKFRNTTIFYGYEALASTTDVNNAITYANNNGCDASNTGVGHQVTSNVSGFLTPKSGDVDASLIVFTGEGDTWGSGEHGSVTDKSGTPHALDNSLNPDGNIMNATITKNGTYVTNGKPHDSNNSLGIDIDTYDMNGILDNYQTSTDITLTTSGDGYMPGMYGFEAELKEVDLCYDYAYRQNNRYFTGEHNTTTGPVIKGSLFSSDPVEVSLYMKNRENSDVTITNLTISVDPIDTRQAIYIHSPSDTTYVTPPNSTQRVKRNPAASDDDYIHGVTIGKIEGLEYFYFYYYLDPKLYNLNMPINAYIDYNASIRLPSGTVVPLPNNHKLIDQDVPFCAAEGFSYTPIFGTFNVQQKDLSIDQYNLYTQVTRRVSDFKVVAYDDIYTDTLKNVTTIVSVELIDVDPFHDTQASCNEPDSALTPRVWVIFDNNVSSVDFTEQTINNAIANGQISDAILHKTSQISNAEDFYDVARRNTAFRVTHQGTGDGSILQLSPGTCVGQQTPPCYEVDNFPDLTQVDVGAGAGNCSQDIDGNPNSTDKIPDYCGNAGVAGLDSRQLAVCMECLYGYGLHYICSRDNFAIRPEAFKVSLSDDNTSTINTDFANNTNKSGAVGSNINLVVGYPYRFDINATTYTDEDTVPGYTQIFDSGDVNKIAQMKWDPHVISTAQALANCNAPVDQNMSFNLVNGTNTNDNPINSWYDLHDKLTDVGEFTFKILDRDWTRYDWDTNYLGHHTGSHYDTSTDCLLNDNSTPSPSDKVGCDISSVHTAPYAEYQPINIESFPYAFDIKGLTVGARPVNDTSGNTFVYINTLDSALYPGGVDENMSYNIQGTYTAVGWSPIRGEGNATTNFTQNCFGKNMDMDMRFIYRSDIPSDTPYLTYDIVDHNTTNPSLTYPNNNAADRIENTPSNYTLTKNVETNITISQPKTVLAQDMEGSVTMDLGYNFDRTYNTPLNPRLIQFNDFNITYAVAAQPYTLYVDGINDHNIYGEIILDKNITFAYARAKPGKELYDDVLASNIDTSVSVVVYCDLGITECANRKLDPLITQTNEAYWWKAWNYDNQNPDGDGTIELVSTPTSALNPTSVVIIPSGGENKHINVSRGAANPPVTIPINLVVFPTTGAYTDRWLIYNEYDNSVPVPFYRVRFIGSSGWAGHGKTGHVVGGDVNKKKNKRLEW